MNYSLTYDDYKAIADLVVAGINASSQIPKGTYISKREAERSGRYGSRNVIEEGINSGMIEFDILTKKLTVESLERYRLKRLVSATTKIGYSRKYKTKNK